VHDGAIYLIINPSGRTAGCIAENSSVAYKVCKADLPTQRWSAATVEGRIRRLTDPVKIYDCFLMLASRLNRDMDKYKKLGKQFSEQPNNSPVYYLPIKNISGKASHNGFYAGE
jgi:nitroimidazol reductase NimA-like FMN-containing flavoprotein (pyridoxamine 5'-phosphate oxidase superfamily)